jgi:hypothetical protein
MRYSGFAESAQSFRYLLQIIHIFGNLPVAEFDCGASQALDKLCGLRD